jgi:hypothetical protein
MTRGRGGANLSPTRDDDGSMRLRRRATSKQQFTEQQIVHRFPAVPV